MKGVVIYCSKYGSTRQYAEWIADELGFEVSPCNVKQNLEHKDLIIFGSWVMGNRLRAGSWLEKNWEELKKKKVIVFSTSGALPTAEFTEMVSSNSFSDEISKQIILFGFRGRMIFQRLSFTDKLMMKIGRIFVKDPEVKKNMLKDFDGVKKQSIKKLVDYVNNLS
ncbi:hypothetical protein GF362_07630 [Candidatus Dojkabacteria bacterium]|nr:hypothetical protein [Candidatus Dojkabacteria bacterium]